MTQVQPLLVGEISIDLVLSHSERGKHVNLGGITHAARGFWALDLPFGVAAFVPQYLESSARELFGRLGCVDFQVAGYVEGAPNITLVGDSKEIEDQGYEEILRETKSIQLTDVSWSTRDYSEILLFPGCFDLASVCERLSPSATLHIDAAYDIEDTRVLETLPIEIGTIFTSTSSPLFLSLPDATLVGVLRAFQSTKSSTFILKENRGGARLVTRSDKLITKLSAQLGTTINSIGVGDVFSASYIAHLGEGPLTAARRATLAAAAYSQTSDDELFKTYVKRDLKRTAIELERLDGVSLPWEKRREYSIYLAAPDFSYVDRSHIELAVRSLSYHNFAVRRPIMENGELPPNSSIVTLRRTFRADYKLLLECELVFAVPINRDPGTLVEIGLAIAGGIPVVVFDPQEENGNTMVIAGAQHYSHDLDSCLSAVFRSFAGRSSQ